MIRARAFLAVALLGGCMASGRDRAREQAIAAQRADRQGMSYEALVTHLQICRWHHAMPQDYTAAVLAETVSKAPWSEEERCLVRGGKIRPGFSEDQVLVAWGEPDRTHTTTYRLGTIKYLHYRSGAVVHLKNGCVDIISQ